MNVTYSSDYKHAYFNGETFTKDEKTGYYLSTQNHLYVGRRLHRVVWEYYNCEIPKGYHVHHIDHNKGNNDISNLRLLTAEQHITVHKDELTEDEKNWYRANLDTKARPKAKEWHKSKEGKTWHKEHYQRTKSKLHVKMEFTCEACGKRFVATKNGNNRFCSNSCKSAFCRKTGKNAEERICVICGKAFATDKYKCTQTCTPKCAAALKKMKRGNSA